MLSYEKETERRARAVRRLDAARHAPGISPAYRRRLDAMRAAIAHGAPVLRLNGAADLGVVRCD